jgi:transglutaminase-like putative cysteine protease
VALSAHRRDRSEDEVEDLRPRKPRARQRKSSRLGLFLILGGVIASLVIVAGCIFLAVWLFTRDRTAEEPDRLVADSGTLQTSRASAKAASDAVEEKLSRDLREIEKKAQERQERIRRDQEARQAEKAHLEQVNRDQEAAQKEKPRPEPVPEKKAPEEPPRKAIVFEPSAYQMLSARYVAYRHRLTIIPQQGTLECTLVILIPQTLEGRQKVLGVQYSPEPVKVFEENDHQYARYVFQNLKQPVELNISVEAELYRHDLDIALAQRKKPSQGKLSQKEEGEALAPWLASEDSLEKDHPLIQESAAQIKVRKELEVVEAALRFVTTKLRYTGYDPKSYGALGALQMGGGKCQEFADLFVALCRAKGIPARVCGGYDFVRTSEDLSHGHAWAEVYLKAFGWVAFDPLHIATGGASFAKIPANRIYTNWLRNDPTLKNRRKYCYQCRGQPVEVKHELIVSAYEPVKRSRAKPR